MKTIGSGVNEIRLHEPFEHRVVYVAKFERHVYILHAFEKKSQQTSKRDIEIARNNYRELLQRLKAVSF